MEPVKFKECNVVFAKDQPEYLPLPAHISPGRDGEATSCWKMSLWERLIVLFTGKVYLQLLTFGGPLQPQILSVRNPVDDDTQTPA